MSKWGNQARKHQKQNQKRRRREKLKREYGVSFEHSNSHVDFEDHKLPNLLLLQVGILTFVVGGTTGPIWWTNHRWIGGVAFALSLLFIVLSVTVGEKDA